MEVVGSEKKVYFKRKYVQFKKYPKNRNTDFGTHIEFNAVEWHIHGELEKEQEIVENIWGMWKTELLYYSF